MGTPSRRPQLDALTSLRFLAAFHVLLYHAQNYLKPLLHGSGGNGLWNAIAAGPNSVGVFFVLSGFILAYTYLGPPEAGRLRRGPFWAARFARVYPVYFLGLLVAAPLAVAGFVARGATAGRYFAVAATVIPLVQAWTPHFALAWNAPAWSLSAEAFFYFVFPFLAPRLWPLGRRGLLLCLVLFWALAQIAPVLYTLAPPGGWAAGWGPPPAFWTAAMNGNPAVRWDNPWYAVIQYNPLCRLPEFLFGVALGRLFLADPGRSPHSAAWSLAGAGAAVALLAAWGFSGEALRQSLFFHNGLLTPLYGLLIYGVARARLGPLARVLSLRPLVALGEASYALYILHVPLLLLLEAGVLHFIGGEVWVVPFLVTYIAVALLSSLVVLRFVEGPARRFLRDRLARFG
jgi:peptidoglycan/LPS O-acetylase OafA/YrhL